MDAICHLHSWRRLDLVRRARVQCISSLEIPIKYTPYKFGGEPIYKYCKFVQLVVITVTLAIFTYIYPQYKYFVCKLLCLVHRLVDLRLAPTSVQEVESVHNVTWVLRTLAKRLCFAWLEVEVADSRSSLAALSAKLMIRPHYYIAC